MTDVPGQKLIAQKDGALGWIIFNNPARHNAISLEMWHAMPTLLEDYLRDEQIRVVVLKGAGDKAFVAGADISQFKEKRSGAQATDEYNAALDKANEALRSCPKPTIAMIRGYCIGGGMGIAAGCDIRIAAEDARFSIPAAKLGLGYAFAGIKRLADIIGPAYAAEIFLTARQFNAQEALQMNLINRLVPTADLESYTTNYANTIARNAPLTLAAVKRSIMEYLKDPTQRDMNVCNKMIADCFASKDYAEGQAAFMEKRMPIFKGQ